MTLRDFALASLEVCLFKQPTNAIITAVFQDSPEPRSSETTEPAIRNEREQKSRPCGSTAVDSDDVPDGTGEVVTSAPEIFRLVPGFVIFARLQAPDFFADFVDFFFKKKKWPTFDRIPEEFRALCDKCGVAAESYEDMPGFAPEWVFHLKIMDYELFWNSIHQFFDKKTFPTWKSLPESITYWFRNLNLREFEYPSNSKFDKLPKVSEERIGLPRKKKSPSTKSFLNSTVMPHEDYSQKPRMMWLLPMPPLGSSEEEQYQRQGRSSVPESSQWVPPQCPAQVQNQYQSMCPLARTIVREHQPAELEEREKRGDCNSDDRDVESDRQDTHFAPKGYRFIPSFVVLSKRLNWDFFPKFVHYFLDNKRWPTFADTPREFQDYCANYGVGPDSYEYLPGFAPEWVFHLRIMDEQWFWKVIHYFFQERVFPCWKWLPLKFETWFKELKLGEFDYPDKKNKYERIPKKIKERFGNFLEHRLRLTKRKFPKPKFPVRLDET
ncbi:Protein of unknown function [Gryllus bimaculatus]|nr:Protein of unknown function [Gryllus bimaculatus]